MVALSLPEKNTIIIVMVFYHLQIPRKIVGQVIIDLVKSEKCCGIVFFVISGVCILRDFFESIIF